MNLKSARLLLSISHVIGRYREKHKGGLKEIHVRFLLSLLIFDGWVTRKNLMLFFKKNSMATNYGRVNAVLARLVKSGLVEEQMNDQVDRLEYRITLDGKILLATLEKEIRRHRADKTIDRIQTGKFKKTDV